MLTQTGGVGVLEIALKKRQAGILNLPTSEIMPSGYQPRRIFNVEELESLAQSISAYGILQPLVVRQTDVGYQLVAGERRLRAAAMAGLSVVPCILYDREEEDCAVATLIENLQRQNLNIWEEAYGYKALLEQLGITQEQLAARVGKSQAAIANKLRLLKLPVPAQSIIATHNLTERHARALLSLSDPAEIFKTLQVIIEKNYNVAQTEQYIERLLHKKPKPMRTVILRDRRLCQNTIHKAIRLIQQAGIKATASSKESDDFIEYTIRIPKG